ncbi:unnamed protein product [Auanema sp. JU1783]|nr:unnamed protein product [Auanema sp. JU1783]
MNIYTFRLCLLSTEYWDDNEPVKQFNNFRSWVVFPTLFASIGLLIALHFHAHNVPTNYILLASFTTVQALTLGCVVSLFELKVIIEAVLLTAVIVFSLFIYTLQSKRDFVKHYALGFSLIGILMMASIMQVFFMSSAFNFTINVIGAAIFCFLLVIDLDMIMNHLSPEDYILACITLYMDVINLFIRILQILNEAQR